MAYDEGCRSCNRGDHWGGRVPGICGCCGARVPGEIPAGDVPPDLDGIAKIKARDFRIARVGDTPKQTEGAANE